MHDVIIIRYGEIALKGKNRIDFEKKLCSSIELTMQNLKIDGKVSRKHGRIFVLTDSKFDELKKICGITSFSYSRRCTYEVEDMKKVVDDQIEVWKSDKNRDFKTFRVTSHRQDKGFKYKSPELNMKLGEYVYEKYKKGVSLKEFDLEVGVEIAYGNSFIYTDKVMSVGGLPLGSTGKVLAFVDEKCEKNKTRLKTLIDSSRLMMKRGCKVILLKKADSNIKTKEFTELENYNCYQPLRIFKYDTEEDVYDYNKNYGAIVTSYTIDEIEKIASLKDHGFLVLNPLIAE